MTRRICLHGPESTGKSTVAPMLAARLGGVVVPEYGRTYAEANGIDFTMDDLVAMAKGQDEHAAIAAAQGADPVILDTDPLMSMAWAQMLFGRHDRWFDRWHDHADLYLLFDIDLQWEADGTRLFGSEAERQRFFDVSRALLEARGVRWAMVRGQGHARFDAALAAIEAAGLVTRRP